MIGAGILALEREDPDYEPDFVVEYRQKVVIPKIEQYPSEKKLAEAFNPYSDVPKELESDGWAFMGLIEVTNLHYRELVDGFLEGKPAEETFSYISRDTTLSRAYLDKLKSIYTSPAYQDWSESHPLREKKLKKEITTLGLKSGEERTAPNHRSARLSQISHPCYRSCRKMDSAGFRPRSTLRSLSAIANRAKEPYALATYLRN